MAYRDNIIQAAQAEIGSRQRSVQLYDAMSNLASDLRETLSSMWVGDYKSNLGKSNSQAIDGPNYDTFIQGGKLCAFDVRALHRGTGDIISHAACLSELDKANRPKSPGKYVDAKVFFSARLSENESIGASSPSFSQPFDWRSQSPVALMRNGDVVAVIASGGYWDVEDSIPGENTFLEETHILPRQDWYWYQSDGHGVLNPEYKKQEALLGRLFLAGQWLSYRVPVDFGDSVRWPNHNASSVYSPSEGLGDDSGIVVCAWSIEDARRLAAFRYAAMVAATDLWSASGNLGSTPSDVFQLRWWPMSIGVLETSMIESGQRDEALVGHYIDALSH